MANELTDQTQGDEALSPMVEAFLWTLNRAREVSRMTALDEESVTSFIMSGVAVSAPLVINLLGSGGDKSRDCYWGSFKKNGGARSSFSETATGADFALVIGMPEQKVRVAIFQAKRMTEVTSASAKGRLDVRRGPAETASGNTQLVMLLSYGWMLMQVKAGQRSASACGNGETLKVAQSLRDRWLQKSLVEHRSLCWIHYVCYTGQDFVTIPLSSIDSKVFDAEFKCASTVKHTLTDSDQNFFELIKMGLVGDGTGWLTLDADVLTAVLPSLVNLGAVFVVDEQGGRDLVNKMEIQDGVVNFVEKMQAPFSTREQIDNWRESLGKPDLNPGGMTPG